MGVFFGGGGVSPPSACLEKKYFHVFTHTKNSLLNNNKQLDLS
jgi:hypothetical protein